MLSGSLPSKTLLRMQLLKNVTRNYKRFVPRIKCQLMWYKRFLQLMFCVVQMRLVRLKTEGQII